MNFTPHRGASFSSVLLALLLALNAVAGTLYVDLNSPNPVAPYSDWGTAATNIQAALDAATVGDDVVVTNGLYQVGGRAVYGAMSNRVAVTKAITLRSVNGPGVTTIKGYQVPGTTNGDAAVRCVYLAPGATLIGFTMTNGATRASGDWDQEQSGGGVWCASPANLVSNCVLAGNSSSSYGAGGGAYSGTLSNCTLTGNSSGNTGGGAHLSTLNHCTLTGNWAFSGGAVDQGTLNDCLVLSNSASTGGGAYLTTLSNCTLLGNSGASGGGAAMAVLVGCTILSNSASSYGGGAYQSTLTNCTLLGNSCFGGGGAYRGTLSGCTLGGNFGTYGGGANGATLVNCTLTNNVASFGGGASGGSLSNCVLANNSATNGTGGAVNGANLNNCALVGNIASSGGGGAGGGALTNCTLANNSSTSGAGANGSMLYNCVIASNMASSSGGGTFQGTLNNCALFGNTAVSAGGGACQGTLNNCTLTGNAAATAGGGASAATLRNCIAFCNTAPLGSNYDSGTFSYCCTLPLPTNGTGNINLEPQLADAFHLTSGSPCRGAGSATYAIGTDIDRQPWANPPSIGCDEFYSGSATGALTASIQASYTNVAPGFAANITALIGGSASASRWDFGDGTVISNRPYASHAWMAPGDYTVVLRVYNDSNPSGVSATLAFHVAATNYYVALDNANPQAPYSSWATAATNIQDAVDSATVAGAVVWVSNGVYAAGGRVMNGALSNRVAVTKPLVLQSVNGPASTIIQGYRVPGTTNGDAALRCVWLTDGAALIGFTLTNGATRSLGDANLERSGGGIWCASPAVVVSNCVLAGNSAASFGGGLYLGTLYNSSVASNSASQGGGVYSSAALSYCTITGNRASGSGGGVYQSTLVDCTLAGNSAISSGGAVFNSTLTNCTLTGNSASSGAGAYAGALSNCTLTGNSASNSGGGVYQGTLVNCTLSGNSASSSGGGAYGSALYSCTLSNNTAAASGGGVAGDSGTLNNCFLAGNSAPIGGGAYYGSLNNCRLIGNRALGVSGSGGGANSSRLYNCGLFGNSASRGGGSISGSLINCTLVCNSASAVGGGEYGSSMINCIAYYNNAPFGPNTYPLSSGTYTCTWPPATRTGSIAAEPQLAGAFHLTASSPCRNAGSAASAGGTDIDGEPWLSPPSVGCDEVYLGTSTGPLTVCIQAALTNVATGFVLDLTGLVDGRVTASRWEFDDGTVVSNRPCASHAWGVPGDYAVVLRAYNDSSAGGITATAMVHVVSQPVHYVALGNPAPLLPFSSWSTAATNIQDAVDSATVAGALICVSNGVYGTGGRVVAGALSNRLAVTYPVVIQSLNGPGVTVIPGKQVPGTTNGDGAMRCVWLTNGSSLIGFTLTNGATRNTGDTYHEGSGGGIWCASSSVLVSNCVLAGNSVSQVAGGVLSGTLQDCTLATNSAPGCGGAFYSDLRRCSIIGGFGLGAMFSTLNDCSIIGNVGGGVSDSMLTNCTIIGNTNVGYGAGANAGTLSGCLLASNTAVSSGGGAYGATLIGCVLMTNSAYGNKGGGVGASRLSNCTILGNYAWEGGGEYGSTLTNCVLAGNWVKAPNGHGGGAYGGTLYNCTLNGNIAGSGGGEYGATLNNCTLTGNNATNTGGAAYAGTLNNCVLYFNTAPQSANYDAGTNLNYCCTTPMPASGDGNFTNPPMFVDQANGDFRLQAISPCINAGANAYAAAAPDLDGNPRILGGTVDVGAYEFQNPASVISYAWLQQYGLAIDGTADTLDSDHDGMSNWQEWRAGTDPTSALSLLRMLTPAIGASGFTVTWQSVTNRTYYLQRSVNLSLLSAFVNLQSNIVGQASSTSFTDTNAVGLGPCFYRVGIQ